MTTVTSSVRAAPWWAAGVALAAYPALRPWADETTMAGLAAMATQRWVLAHLLGMAGFVLLALWVRGWARSAPTSRRLRVASSAAALAVVLLLPYYGGEGFALPAIGRYAVAHDRLDLLSVVDGFRYQPLAVLVFGLGLVALAVVGVLIVVESWSRGGWTRAAGLAVGVPLALYLPQFYAPAAGRVLHGVVLGVGCLAVGWLTAQNSRGESEPSSSISQRLVSSSRPGSPPL